MLTIVLEMARYIYSSFAFISFDNRGGLEKHLLSCWNASSHSWSQINSLFLLKILRNGALLSEDFEMNLLKVVNWSARFYTSFLFLGKGIFRRAFTCSWEALIHLWLMIYPKKFPVMTPKVNFVRFNFIWYLWSILKASPRSIMWSSSCILLTRISLMYTSMLLLVVKNI